MKNFVINLDRTPERYATFYGQNRLFLNHERFSAIDGLISQFPGSLFDKNLPYTSGAKGCAASHIELWRRCVELNEPITVIEDDVAVNRFFKIAIDSLVPRSMYDIVVWGFNFDCPVQFEMIPGLAPCLTQYSEEKLLENWQKSCYSDYAYALYPLTFCFGTPCYTVSPEGAKKLLDKLLPLRPFKMTLGDLGAVENTGIDIAMNREYSCMRSYVCFPPLAFTLNDKNSSTVQK